MRRTTAVLGLSAALTFAACDNADSPTAPTGDSAATSATAVDQALARNLELGVERAEFSGGFCFFVVFEGEEVNGYSGASKTVTTPSGVQNYHCKGDLLFGPGLSDGVDVRDVTFTGDFAHGPLASCHVRATPGPNGQANVNCHDVAVED